MRQRLRFVSSAIYAVFTALVGCTSEAVVTASEAALDVTNCPAGANVITGTEGDDVLVGTEADDCIVGLGGDDTISAFGGNDFVIGGEGNDTIDAGDGDDRVYGEGGDDALTSGAGDDLVFAGDGDDVVVGGTGHDTLRGAAGDDVLLGEAGNDKLYGGDGNDVVDGDGGNDSLFGEAGNDVVLGRDGTSALDGGDGDDACDHSGEACESEVSFPACGEGATCAAGETCVTDADVCVACWHDSECDDGDASTSDTCAPATGCVFTPLAPPVPFAGPACGEATGSQRTGNLPASQNALRPTLRWGAVDDAVHYEIELTTACALDAMQSCAFDGPVVRAMTHVPRYTPSAKLTASGTAPRGSRHFWRVRWCDGDSVCSQWSRVRYLDVGRIRSDFNGDGFGDSATATASGRVVLHHGRADGLAYRALLAPAGGEADAFGASVAAIGDVNADGFADLAVGAPASGDGQVRVYFGSAAGIASTPSATLDAPSGEAVSAFGSVIAGIGDVDCDGYADVAVSAEGVDGNDDPIGLVFLYRGSASGLAALPTSTLGHDAAIEQASAAFGAAVASAGDFDGDGFGDFAVGAPQFDAEGDDDGAIFLFRGGASGIDAAPSAVFDHPTGESGAALGSVLARAGDLNGDGLDDLVAGVPASDVDESDEGRVFAWFGNLDAAAWDPDVWLDAPVAGVDVHFGAAVVVGDFDANGFDDIVAGAPGADGSAEDAGMAFFFRATGDGIVGMPAASWGATLAQVGMNFGSGMASTGDANADGYPDVLVSAPLAEAPSAEFGADHGLVQSRYGSASAYFSTAKTHYAPAPVDGEQFGAACMQ